MGNPFIVGRFGTAQECVERYARGLSEKEGLVPYGDLHELRGKTLFAGARSISLAMRMFC